MPNILVIGSGPLPEPGQRRTCGSALRTWQVCRPLVDSPHTVHLFALPAADARNGGTAPRNAIRTASCDGFRYSLLPNADADQAVDALGRAIERIRPTCLVAVDSLAAHVGAQLRGRLPLWVDFGEFPMVEAQVNARMRGDDTRLAEAWERERNALLRADKFSTASMPHLYALLGELAAVGRLNRWTAQYHFAHYTPHAIHPLFTRPPAATHPALRRSEMPADACAILWSGSFDSWVDADALFAGVEKAMALNPKIHFVATGGQVDGRDEITYRRFAADVERSANAARYHLLGWVDLDRLPAIYRECDLGLCVDGKHYETLFGARRRLVNMMAAGLPVASALGSEISHILGEEGIGFTFAAGEPEELAKILQSAARQPHALRSLGQKGRHYVMRHLTASALMKPLRAWVDEPRLAPDNAEKDRLAPPEARLLDVPLNAIQEKLLGRPTAEGAPMTPTTGHAETPRAPWWRTLADQAKDAATRLARKTRKRRDAGG
ncbi:MAG: glycosyltransferase family 4 protein [Candidatus Sumerlaeota bacterium]|nr:glycosyltransferase family 4 protein [Candidatus Sumerlaeota bacterium]